MNPFITFRELINGQLEYFILQRAFPHMIGKISTFPKEKAIVNAPIAGYNLYVTFDGCLQGNVLPSYRNIDKEVQNVFENMAAWFWSERIVGSEKKFEKFKIKTNAITHQ